MSLTLNSISQKLLQDAISMAELESTLAEFKALLIKTTSLDLSRSEHKKDINLENGIAIGLNWAAACLDDASRTRKFILGTKLAVDQKLSEGKKPVQLLYAGTGPFATLILPLLSHFSSDELQVTLLDINPESIENVTQLINRFGFKNHVNEILCADAMNITLPYSRKSNDIDILLSETMQHALQAELQVPITCHLLNQLSEDALLIPHSINLHVIAVNSQGKESESTRVLGELMKVDTNFLRTQYPINADWSFERSFEIPESLKESSLMLAISTEIHVFESVKIEWNESGLTVPKYLESRNTFVGFDKLALRYSIVPEPGFQLLNASTDFGESN